MKKVFIISISIFFTLSAMSQGAGADSRTDPARHPKGRIKRYCFFIQNGAKTLTKNGITVSNDVTLLDGTKVSPEGMVSRPDGTQTGLLNGQCIDELGIISK